MGRLAVSATRWRERRSTRRVRWAWTLTAFLGYASWLWVVHRWAVAGGRDYLVEGVRQPYVAVAACTYFPLACGLWLLAFPGDRRPFPWAEEDEPLRFMGKPDAEALAQAVRDDTGLHTVVTPQGSHFAVDVDTPATRYRLLREDEWPDLRRRLVERER